MNIPYTDNHKCFATTLAIVDRYFIYPLYFLFIVIVAIGHNVNEFNILYVDPNSSLLYKEIIAFNCIIAFTFLFKFGGLYSLYDFVEKYNSFIENNFLISKRNIALTIVRTFTISIWLILTTLYAVYKLDPTFGFKFTTSFTYEFIGLGALCIILNLVCKAIVSNSYKWYEKSSFLYKDENTLARNVKVENNVEISEFLMTARFLYKTDYALAARYRESK